MKDIEDKQATSWKTHTRMHHPASSCADNTAGDAGAGGGLNARARVCVCVSVFERALEGGDSMSELFDLIEQVPSTSGLLLRKRISSVYSAAGDARQTLETRPPV